MAQPTQNYVLVTAKASGDDETRPLVCVAEFSPPGPDADALVTGSRGEASSHSSPGQQPPLRTQALVAAVAETLELPPQGIRDTAALIIAAANLAISRIAGAARATSRARAASRGRAPTASRSASRTRTPSSAATHSVNCWPVQFSRKPIAVLMDLIERDLGGKLTHTVTALSHITWIFHIDDDTVEAFACTFRPPVPAVAPVRLAPPTRHYDAVAARGRSPAPKAAPQVASARLLASAVHSGSSAVPRDRSTSPRSTHGSVVLKLRGNTLVPEVSDTLARTHAPASALGVGEWVSVDADGRRRIVGPFSLRADHGAGDGVGDVHLQHLHSSAGQPALEGLRRAEQLLHSRKSATNTEAPTESASGFSRVVDSIQLRASVHAPSAQSPPRWRAEQRRASGSAASSSASWVGGDSNARHGSRLHVGSTREAMPTSARSMASVTEFATGVASVDSTPQRPNRSPTRLDDATPCTDARSKSPATFRVEHPRYRSSAGTFSSEGGMFLSMEERRPSIPLGVAEALRRAASPATRRGSLDSAIPAMLVRGRVELRSPDRAATPSGASGRRGSAHSVPPRATALVPPSLSAAGPVPPLQMSRPQPMSGAKSPMQEFMQTWPQRFKVSNGAAMPPTQHDLARTSSGTQGRDSSIKVSELLARTGSERADANELDSIEATVVRQLLADPSLLGPRARASRASENVGKQGIIPASDTLAHSQSSRPTAQPDGSVVPTEHSRAPPAEFATGTLGLARTRSASALRASMHAEMGADDAQAERLQVSRADELAFQGQTSFSTTLAKAITGPVVARTPEQVVRTSQQAEVAPRIPGTTGSPTRAATSYDLFQSSMQEQYRRGAQLKRAASERATSAGRHDTGSGVGDRGNQVPNRLGSIASGTDTSYHSAALLRDDLLFASANGDHASLPGSPRAQRASSATRDAPHPALSRSPSRQLRRSATAASPMALGQLDEERQKAMLKRSFSRSLLAAAGVTDDPLATPSAMLRARAQAKTDAAAGLIEHANEKALRRSASSPPGSWPRARMPAGATGDAAAKPAHVDETHEDDWSRLLDDDNITSISEQHEQNDHPAELRSMDAHRHALTSSPALRGTDDPMLSKPALVRAQSASSIGRVPRPVVIARPGSMRIRPGAGSPPLVQNNTAEDGNAPAHDAEQARTRTSQQRVWVMNEQPIRGSTEHTAQGVNTDEQKDFTGFELQHPPSEAQPPSTVPDAAAQGQHDAWMQAVGVEEDGANVACMQDAVQYETVGIPWDGDESRLHSADLGVSPFAGSDAALTAIQIQVAEIERRRKARLFAASAAAGAAAGAAVADSLAGTTVPRRASMDSAEDLAAARRRSLELQQDAAAAAAYRRFLEQDASAVVARGMASSAWHGDTPDDCTDADHAHDWAHDHSLDVHASAQTAGGSPYLRPGSAGSPLGGGGANQSFHRPVSPEGYMLVNGPAGVLHMPSQSNANLLPAQRSASRSRSPTARVHHSAPWRPASPSPSPPVPLAPTAGIAAGKRHPSPGASRGSRAQSAAPLRRAASDSHLVSRRTQLAVPLLTSGYSETIPPAVIAELERIFLADGQTADRSNRFERHSARGDTKLKRSQSFGPANRRGSHGEHASTSRHAFGSGAPRSLSPSTAHLAASVGGDQIVAFIRSLRARQHTDTAASEPTVVPVTHGPRAEHASTETEAQAHQRQSKMHVAAEAHVGVGLSSNASSETRYDAPQYFYDASAADRAETGGGGPREFPVAELPRSAADDAFDHPESRGAMLSEQDLQVTRVHSPTQHNASLDTELALAEPRSQEDIVTDAAVRQAHHRPSSPAPRPGSPPSRDAADAGHATERPLRPAGSNAMSVQADPAAVQFFLELYTPRPGGAAAGGAAAMPSDADTSAGASLQLPALFSTAAAKLGFVELREPAVGGGSVPGQSHVSSGLVQMTRGVPVGLLLWGLFQHYVTFGDPLQTTMLSLSKFRRFIRDLGVAVDPFRSASPPAAGATRRTSSASGAPAPVAGGGDDGFAFDDERTAAGPLSSDPAEVLRAKWVAAGKAGPRDEVEVVIRHATRDDVLDPSLLSMKRRRMCTLESLELLFIAAERGHPGTSTPAARATERAPLHTEDLKSSVSGVSPAVLHRRRSLLPSDDITARPRALLAGVSHNNSVPGGAAEMTYTLRDSRAQPPTTPAQARRGVSPGRSPMLARDLRSPQRATSASRARTVEVGVPTGASTSDASRGSIRYGSIVGGQLGIDFGQFLVLIEEVAGRRFGYRSGIPIFTQYCLVPLVERIGWQLMSRLSIAGVQATGGPVPSMTSPRSAAQLPRPGSRMGLGTPRTGPVKPMRDALSPAAPIIAPAPKPLSRSAAQEVLDDPYVRKLFAANRGALSRVFAAYASNPGLGEGHSAAASAAIVERRRSASVSRAASRGRSPTRFSVSAVAGGAAAQRAAVATSSAAAALMDVRQFAAFAQDFGILGPITDLGTLQLIFSTITTGDVARQQPGASSAPFVDLLAFADFCLCIAALALTTRYLQRQGAYPERLIALFERLEASGGRGKLMNSPRVSTVVPRFVCSLVGM